MRCKRSLLWKIKMWWWYHTNKERYYKEYWVYFYDKLGEAANRANESIKAFAEAARKFGE